MNSSDERLKRRIEDLARQAHEQRVYTHTGFLTPVEQDVYLSVKKELPVEARLFGGSESCIRKLVLFGSEEEFGYEAEMPIRILHIAPKAEKFAEECSHRDYLGSVMALGIERKLTGDIVVRGKEAWMYVLESAADFITEHLTQVRHTAVVCEPVSGEVPELKPRFQKIEANIASERLDLILAAAAGFKREEAKKVLAEDKVFVNGRLAASPGQKLKEGDELVIRGVGKFIFDGIAGTSKKGRLFALMRKYL